MGGSVAGRRRRAMRRPKAASTARAVTIAIAIGRWSDDEDVGAPAAFPALAWEPFPLRCTAVVGGDVADFGSNMVSSDSALPGLQFTVHRRLRARCRPSP